jgi:hypothetical protein
MAKYSYEIGTVAAGVAGMTNVESLTTTCKCVPPRGKAVERFSVYRTAADGTVYGDGYPKTEWTFDVIEQAQLDKLLEFVGSAQSARVLIRTRDDDGTYTPYEAVMHRPTPRDTMQARFNGRWGPVTIRFTMLEEQEEPE